MGMNENWTPDERRLSDALHERASSVQPSAGALGKIRSRTTQAPWWRRPATLGLAVASATAGAVITIALVVTSPDDDSTPTGLPSSTDVTSTDDAMTSSDPTEQEPEESETLVDTDSPTSSPSVAPPQPAVDDYLLPVYYTVQIADGEQRLAREFHPTETDEPIAAAVRQMFGNAADPDYVSLWDPATEVLSAARSADMVVIDLSNPQTTSGSSEADQLAVQQLVYTATAAAYVAHGESAASVQVLVDGEPRPVFDAVDLTQPQSRADWREVQLLVQINEPLSGERYTSPVTVTGSAIAFEATLEWEIRDDDGNVVASDFTNTEECCEQMSPFSFDVDLDPGTYTVEVRETDPSGGEGPPPRFDTKTFTVPSS
jgi:spore germination protein GerM